MMITRQERIAGGLWGLLIGDALGVPYEFYNPEHLPPRALIEMQPPENFERSHGRVAPGTWSDDGAQALVLLASLQKQGGLDLDELGRDLLRWYKYGYMAIDQKVFDIGVQTSKAIRHLMQGVSAEHAGPSDEYANGNGSLMRILPLVLWHQGTDEELVKLAHEQSRLTHGHIRSQVCCALYCLWAKRLLDGQTPQAAWRNATATLRTIYGESSQAYNELETKIRPNDEAFGLGTGYVVDSLHSVRMVLNQPTFEDVLKSAIMLGNDTDTTACIAGGLAGIRFGVKAIPERWMQALLGKEMVEPLLDKLLQPEESWTI